MHRLTEHRADQLSGSRPRLPNKVSPGLVIIVFVQHEISLIFRDNLHLSFPLLLVFLDPLILVNTVHEPTHTPYKLLGQQLSQIILGR